MVVSRAGRAWHFACRHVARRSPMKRGIVVLTVGLACSSPVYAAPGDPRLIEGVLEWPAQLTVEPFLVVRTKDGGRLYADVEAAKRLGSEMLTAGARLTVIGREASRPFEITAASPGPGDRASRTATRPRSPRGLGAPRPQNPPWHRLDRAHRWTSIPRSPNRAVSCESLLASGRGRPERRDGWSSRVRSMPSPTTGSRCGRT